MGSRKGSGSVSFSKSKGLYVGRIELPSHDGKRRRKEFAAKTKAGLIAKRNAYLKQLAESGDLPTASMTVERYVDYWMREVVEKTRRPKTVASYRSNVKHIVAAIGKTRLDKVTASTVRRVITHMERQELSPTTQRNVHSVMSAMFADAEREQRVPRNPVELVPAPLKGIPDLDVLTAEEAVRLVTAFRDQPDAFLWATFLLTGARRGEILGLTWDRVSDELDLSWQLQRLPWHHGCAARDHKGPWPCGRKRGADCPKKRIVTPANYEARQLEGGLYLTRPKSRAGWRIIPLVEPLASILAEWRALAPSNLHDLVFTIDGRPIDPDFATSMWPQVLKTAGIHKHVRIHDLRHTAVDLLYDAGVPEHLIMQIVGHSTRAMSRAYRSNTNREALRAGMTQFAALFAHDGERRAIES